MKKVIILSLAIFMMAQVSIAKVIKYKQQTVYVPAYSHIYVGPEEKPIDLAITLSIRNTNANESIMVSVADYYDSEGKAVESFITKHIELKPFATTRFIISDSDKTGGSGANFIVKWHAEKRVNAPVVESIMIGTRASHGISFKSRGIVIEE